ncbi:MAG: peptidoglycan-binding protein [Clostridia bacterium]|nr:peptidoglycan-binding protein [Clostridia bacterium]
MVTIFPYVPQNITVHLGPPAAIASNVTVSFPDYVKNVASSEVYPTWRENALRANILAIISYALNRVYTEFYRSRGYAFDITSSTAYDQNFVYGRSFFSTIERIVDEIFNNYLRRSGTLEPLPAKFCNGTTVTCSGLSQWGSQNLAQQGYSYIRIIRYYYGQDVELVANAPVRGYTSSYPGFILRNGSSGPNVIVVQQELNRISQNYPAIGTVAVDGRFGSRTEAAVRRFQEAFGLTADGLVGRATWYALVRVYVAVTRLSELDSEGQRFYSINWNFPRTLSLGARGTDVRNLQYLLSVAAEFINSVNPVSIDGVFGEQTRQAVIGFQRYAGLSPDGVVGNQTWDRLYNQVAGIRGRVLDDTLLPAIDTTPRLMQSPAQNLQLGSRD